MDLCVERRNLFAVNCQPNLFLKFLSRVSSDNVDIIINFRAKRSYFMVEI